MEYIMYRNGDVKVKRDYAKKYDGTSVVQSKDCALKKESIHSLSTIQLDRDAASRVVKDSGSYKAGNAIAQGKDDDHYIVRYFREQRIMLVNMIKEQKTA